MKSLLVLLFGMLFAAQAIADVSQPVVSDSRVKTLVYNENEVYTILTQYGYQSNIEFGRSEEIQTISVGDRVAWQIIPAGRRLFIQTLQDDAQTNLTVVTDRHSYQFDLRSTSHAKGNEDKLVYVARFYYPEEGWDAAQQSPISASGDELMKQVDGSEYNFNYTYSGADATAPVKIFDDGKATYFQFRNGITPSSIAVVNPAGQEMPVQVSTLSGYTVVSTTAPQFSLHMGRDVVCVFNEKLRGH